MRRVRETVKAAITAAAVDVAGGATKSEETVIVEVYNGFATVAQMPAIVLGSVIEE